jgi:hypothetical protein
VGDRDMDKRDPARELGKVLQSCLWQPLSEGLWQKGQVTLRVDEVGIFIYQEVRIHGLSHNRIRPRDLKGRVIWLRDGNLLDLETGGIF